MSHLGVLSIIGLFVIMLTLFTWIFMTLRASTKPVLGNRSGEKLKRGPVEGGVIQGEPGRASSPGRLRAMRKVNIRTRVDGFSVNGR